MKGKTIKGSIVADYIGKYPGLKKNKMRLAKLIYSNHPEAFKDVEDVRYLVRYQFGATGKKNRKSIKPENVYIGTQFSWNNLPDGEMRVDWSNPYKIKGDKVLIISDLHIPYHSKDALVMALEYGYREGIDTIYINGDLFDFYKLSNFAKDPTRRSFIEELDMGRELLTEIRSNFSDIDIIYKAGNHDFWYDKYMMTKAPELYGIAAFKLENILKLKKLNIRFLDSLKWSKFGKLSIAHGHEGGRSFTNPVSASRGVFLKGFESIIVGHYHQPSSFTDNTWSGKPITTWSTGCMCDLHPEFCSVNRWSWGFAIAEKINGKGAFMVHNKRIHKGVVVPV